MVAPNFSNDKGLVGTKTVIKVVENTLTSYRVHTRLWCGITLVLLRLWKASCLPSPLSW